MLVLTYAVNPERRLLKVRSKEVLEAKAQKIINLALEWADKHKLTLNPAKTDYDDVSMYFSDLYEYKHVYLTAVGWACTRKSFTF